MATTARITKGDPDLEKIIDGLEKKIQKRPLHPKLLSNLLIFLDCQTPNNSGLGQYSECQRALNNYLKNSDFKNFELSIMYLIENYDNWFSLLNNYKLNFSLPITQAFQGDYIYINSNSADCKTYLKMFNETGVINRLCDDCYKVQILPTSVNSLIFTYLVMMKIKFKRNNRRKCMVEVRDNVPFPYKGYVFCESENEAENCLGHIRETLQAAGVHDLVYKISHGCSEYGMKYPSFRYSKSGTHRSFQRPNDWIAVENSYAASAHSEGIRIEDQSNSVLTVRDLYCFETWISYANAIGDFSYKQIKSTEIHAKGNMFAKLTGQQASKRKIELAKLKNQINPNLIES